MLIPNSGGVYSFWLVVAYCTALWPLIKYKQNKSRDRVIMLIGFHEYTIWRRT